jgi:hypothetical protein
VTPIRVAFGTKERYMEVFPEQFFYGRQETIGIRLPFISNVNFMKRFL